ncbi:zonular occludens toxin domain-containing protein [Acinetobacter beijerinckii]|uniref:zonular occludens toxin domain-containing protein n=1 Tax=Acinetobacter beijerinckii TaxID=262668 RepID=UPI0030DD5B53
MLYLVTGTPGSQKTAWTVNKLDLIEKSNFINVRKNKIIFEHNKKLFEQFKDEFLLYIYEVGSGSDRKTEIEMLSEDYFDFLNEDYEDLRPDDYFKKITRYNEIVDRINDSYGKQDFQFLQPVRTIYTNIKACKIPYSRPLIYDWRDAPDGSIIVIDEIQLVEPYKNKKSEDEMIMHLTIHRHRGFDFYIITQATRYLHPVMKELFTAHYHLTRPFGWTCKVYLYGSARDNPNALINKINCESKTAFKPADRIFTLYKSTTIDTSEKRIPRFIYFIGAFVIIMICLFFYFVTKDNVIYDQVSNGLDGKPVNQTTQQTGQKQTTTTPEQKTNLDTECRKAVNVEKPQCIEWFNDLSKNNGSVQNQSARNSSITYNPSKPFDQTIEEQLEYEATAKPVFSGCIKKNGKYIGYSQQGTVLNVSQDDCKRLLEDGDRPFNYFAQQQTERVSTSEQTQSASKTSPL